MNPNYNSISPLGKKVYDEIMDRDISGLIKTSIKVSRIFHEITVLESIQPFGFKKGYTELNYIWQIFKDIQRKWAHVAIDNPWNCYIAYYLGNTSQEPDGTNGGHLFAGGRFHPMPDTKAVSVVAASSSSSVIDGTELTEEEMTKRIRQKTNDNLRKAFWS